MDLFNYAEDFKEAEAEWKCKDGTPITVRCSGRRIAHNDGEAAYFEMFVEDITDRRILERQLRMAGKMEAVGRLSGGIAHDFNNLLGVIIGYSQLLKRALGAESHLVEHVEPELQSVRADRNQIEQVIMNLAVNSRDAMPAGGELRIETKNVHLDEAYTRMHSGAKVGQYVCLSVSDTGGGMDAETLAHIFEPFFTTKEMGKGTGLGLATVYGIVKQSGGYVWVDSEPNKGASFQIFLPRVAEVSQSQVARPYLGENLRGSETILLVEDAEAIRKLAAEFLSSHGFEVLSASNAEEAVSIATAHAGAIQLLRCDHAGTKRAGVSGKTGGQLPAHQGFVHFRLHRFVHSGARRFGGRLEFIE
jgi:nitrogen-specific signal transduction histidine kinase